MELRIKCAYADFQVIHPKPLHFIVEPGLLNQGS